MTDNRSHKAYLLEYHGPRLLDLLPLDGSPVSIRTLAAGLGLVPAVVGRLAGLLKRSVVRSEPGGQVMLARAPSLCQVAHGPR